jgi:hypothetical protein
MTIADDTGFGVASLDNARKVTGVSEVVRGVKELPQLGSDGTMYRVVLIDGDSIALCTVLAHTDKDVRELVSTNYGQAVLVAMADMTLGEVVD